MKVLIGIDGSPGSQSAIQQGAALLSPQRDEVCLYYSTPTVRLGAGGSDAALRERAREALADAVFADARKQLPPALGERITTVVGHQNPAHGLLVAADEWRADLIVVGARGLGRLQRLLLGSVSGQVVQSATIPVLVARGEIAEAADAAQRVLLCCDGSETSQHAAKFIEQFDFPAGTTGRAITVVESVFGGEVPPWLEEQARESDEEAMAHVWAEEHEKQRTAKEASLTEYCANLPAIFQGNMPLVVEGLPAEQVLAAIRKENISLVVLGARGLSRWARLMMGSTSEKVLAHAPCSVLVVRQHEQP